MKKLFMIASILILFIPSITLADTEISFYNISDEVVIYGLYTDGQENRKVVLGCDFIKPNEIIYVGYFEPYRKYYAFIHNLDAEKLSSYTIKFANGFRAVNIVFDGKDTKVHFLPE